MADGETLTGRVEVIKLSFNIAEKLEQVVTPGKADVVRKPSKVKEKPHKPHKANQQEIDLSALYTGEGIQAVHTPNTLCREMVDMLKLATDVKDKRILTLNIEFIPELTGADVWFFSDNDAKAGFAETYFPWVHIIRGNFLEWETNMKFDVVVMNPPYQQEDGGHSRSAKPIYHRFIERAIDVLKPDYLVSVNPSRWMMGGKGLDTFRTRMMADRRVRQIVDFTSADEIFPEVDITGGVNYFLWDKEYNGKCSFNGVERALDEEDIVIRENEARSILTKVKNVANKWVSETVSPRKPYGLEGLTGDEIRVRKEGGVPCWFKQSIGLISIDSKFVKNPRNDLHLWRVLVPYATPGGGRSALHRGVFFGQRSIVIAKPGEYCTETFIVLHAFSREVEAKNFTSYLNTRFFRFMLRMRMVSQHITRECYKWVPDLGDYSKPWTDVELYKMFRLTKQERDYIESKIKELA